MNNKSYTTLEIAEMIDSTVDKVNYYIRKNFLKADLDGNKFKIKRSDFIYFYDNYYNTDKRNSKRGVSKKLTQEKINLLFKVIEDTKNNKISFESFMKKYQAEQDNIPNFKDFLIYKRDTFILLEKKEGVETKDIALKFGLKENTVRKFLNQNKESNF